MNLAALLTSTFRDTLSTSMPLVRPEACLAVSIVLILLLRTLPLLKKLDSGLVALGGVCFALWYAWSDVRALPGSPWALVNVSAARVELFTGLLVYDSLTAYVRLLLMGFLVLYILFTKVSGIPDHEDGADFYTLMLGATLGMCLMASANHLLMIFMAVEMASVPSYVMAGLLKGRRTSSEAALKYAVFGAGAAGVMLYGVSLLAGVLGTCHLPSMALRLADLSASGGLETCGIILALGGLMMSVGLAFKLSAVPFHFWCPDVFEGAAAEVGAFLSVASKAAAIALLVRVAFGLGVGVDMGDAVAVLDSSNSTAMFQGVAPLHSQKVPDVVVDSQRLVALEDVRHFIVSLIGLLAAVTCTFGNLAAYGQTNIKRLLAYSTIAHAGYLMMPVAAGLAMAGINPQGSQAAIAAVAFYLGTYVFMNLGAFAIVAVLRNQLRSEEIASYAGLVRTSPGIVVAMAVVLVSLIGLPPLAGFVSKFLIFASLYQAISSGAERPMMILLLVLGGVNTVVSLFYYLRVVKVMTADPPPEQGRHAEIPMVSLSGAMITGIVFPVVFLGVFWSGLYVLAMLAGGMAS
ncbi:MAG: NADH-quinone oxidoreductase subunit N [Planctomycetota bacterium]|nr:NADH-quinone oxidoreductase subunit N [Planctomycetia bacterium]MDO7678054.1 NADH-quinone oxidoreductase subunit N [Pirellulales bacterium]RLS30524.1 MAG: NADH-quinone oxidoreductase subunit N [Planctomycetota bacterium]